MTTIEHRRRRLSQGPDKCWCVSANGTFVPIAAAGAACEVRGCGSMSSRICTEAQRQDHAGAETGARRGDQLWHAGHLPWTFSRISNAVPL